MRLKRGFGRGTHYTIGSEAMRLEDAPLSEVERRRCIRLGMAGRAAGLGYNDGPYHAWTLYDLAWRQGWVGRPGKSMPYLTREVLLALEAAGLIAEGAAVVRRRVLARKRRLKRERVRKRDRRKRGAPLRYGRGDKMGGR